MTQSLISYLSAQDRINFEKRYGPSPSDDEMRAHLANFVIDNAGYGSLSEDKLITSTQDGASFFFEGWVRLSPYYELDFCIYLPDALAQALKPGYINDIASPDLNQWFIILDDGQSFLAPDLAALQNALPKVQGLQIAHADPFDNILASAAQRVMDQEGFGGIIVSSLLKRIKARAQATSEPMNDDITLWVLEHDDQLAYIQQDPLYDMGEEYDFCPTCER